MLKKRTISLMAVTSGVISMLMAGSVLAAPINPVSHADWLQKKAIVEGDIGGDLVLGREVTTAELVTVLARLRGEASSLKADPAYPHWASAQLAWAKGAGIITDAEAREPDAEPSATRIIQIAAAASYNLPIPALEKVTRADFLHTVGEAITTRVTIGHTNDVHGHIDENKSGGEFGYAKLATLVKDWRKESPNFLLIDAGDTTQGTVFVNQFKGESVLPILEKLDYDLMVAGNHEFDFGYEQLLKLKGQLDFPVLNASVRKADGSNLLQQSAILESGGIKFAVTSVLAEDTPILTHPDNVKGLTFENPVEAAKRIVPELKKQADRVILVSHAGYDVDVEIAKQVPGIDIIIGGHSHTKLSKPVLVNGTYIVQDWEYGKALGRADLYYLGKELVAVGGGLKEYDEKVEADPGVAALVKEVTGKIDQVLNVVIAKTEVDLDGDRTVVRKRESNLGNLIADTLLAKTKSIPGYQADIALTNGGGIRTQVKAGDITKKALYDVLPFPNTVVIVEVKGSDVRAALENGVSQVENGAGRFPQVSGLSFTYNPSMPAGERVVDVKVGETALDPDKVYKLVTNDFVAAGGDGYSVFQGKKSLNTGITLYELMEEALLSQKTVHPKTDGRISEVK